MSGGRKRLAKGISVSSFAAGVAGIGAELERSALASAVRLTYTSEEVAAVLGLEPFVVPDRLHFMLQGRLANEPAAAAGRFAAAARSTANFEQAWGSWLLSLARDGQGARTVSSSRIVRPGAAAPPFLDLQLGPLLRGAGAEERQGCLRLEEGVRLELWSGSQERLQAKEVAPGHPLVDELVARVFAGLGASPRVLVTMKSAAADLRSWLAADLIRPAADFQPFASYEVEVGDWRSNVEEERLGELATKLDAELGSSGGALEVLAIEPQPAGPAPVAALHCGWSRRGTEVSWVPLGRDPRQLDRAWRAVETARAF